MRAWFHCIQLLINSSQAHQHLPRILLQQPGKREVIETMPSGNISQSCFLACLGGLPHLLPVPWLCCRWWVSMPRNTKIGDKLFSALNTAKSHVQISPVCKFKLKVVQTLTGTVSPPCVLLALLTLTGSFASKIPVWNRTPLPFLPPLEWIPGTYFSICSPESHSIDPRLPGGVVARHREGVPSEDYRHLWLHVPCHLLSAIHTNFSADFLLFGYSAPEYLKAAGSNCSFQ